MLSKKNKKPTIKGHSQSSERSVKVKINVPSLQTIGAIIRATSKKTITFGLKLHMWAMEIVIL
jgi:hypothetical protein